MPPSADPAHVDGPFSLWLGDARGVLRGLPEGSVDCVVTSPPYWSLRDYKLEPTAWGGDDGCEHEWGDEMVARLQSGNFNAGFNERWGRATGDRKQEEMRPVDVRQGRFCSRCGAWMGQLGLEPTPQLFVSHLVEVFAEVHRVLAPHGTVWLNIGDSYVARAKGSLNGQERSGLRTTETQEHAPTGIDKTESGIPAKNLALVPARLELALQEWGWIVRADVVWAKENPMPESVADRPSRSHERVLMLVKEAAYYFDQEAVREPHKPDGRKTTTRTVGNGSHGNYGEFGHEEGRERWPNGGRNVRDVWTIPTQSFSASWLGIEEDDHFAAFPEELARRCIEASAPRWVCSRCGAPRYRIVQRVGGPQGDHLARTAERDGADEATRETGKNNRAGGSVLAQAYKEHGYAEMRTLGWTECPCQIGLPSDSFAPILTPLGESEDGYEDPSMETGRAGMNRERNGGEGVRPTTRFEQRAYADQLRELRALMPATFREVEEALGEEAVAHYMRKDAAGARPIPQAALDDLIAGVILSRVELPEVPPGEYRPGRVLDPFMGSGTTAAIARRLNREVWGAEANPRYVRIAAARAAKFWLRPTPPRRRAEAQTSLLDDVEEPAGVVDGVGAFSHD